MRIRNSITAKLYLAVSCTCIPMLLLHVETIRTNVQRSFAAFLNSQAMETLERTWWLILAACFMVAGLTSFSLTRERRLRLRHLVDGMQAIGQGKFSTRLPVDIEDEIGRLARDFNEMAQALEHSDRSRCDFMTDISHELRAAISVMRDEMEAMRDGVRQPSATPLATWSRYVHRLGALVNDLHDLNMTDAGTLNYRFEAVELGSLVMRLEQDMRPRFSRLRLKLKVDHDDERVMIHAEPRRILQLLENLLENSLHWTDPGGMVELRYTVVMETVVITLENSAPGVATALCKRLFDRFHRIDSPRLRADGGSGLGLAICRNIVEAHQGVIAASPSRLGGLMVTLCIPTFVP
ncbi:ATP-binding protein [Pseudomonas aeruginosa]|uniref:ATP-binding protein n=1 Tax=Stenotrophomonas TaxID=40323 RepID=UPI0007B1B44A|nr:ATP-binding protein [Stenotrophomonas maltophilia]HBN8683289.1 HAMP domain-containing protein [Pseudomonas aeruginosa]KZE42246.1 hypothetical protein AVW14_19945 [Stenotrophomonas maltophilia]OHY66909.1 hypothetical protein BB780_15775 [Stenotrophomonas maltophilia]HBO4390798.1 HAMP domain-containing protein [Pseudomonas aeruginosa]HEJ5934946.1 HAMP domain-containing protein [Pseudomonas aeruginosa]